MTDIPLPATGSTNWSSWAAEQEDLSDAARDFINSRRGGVLDAVAEFGLSPSNTAADNATRLNNAFTTAIAGNLECYIGPGTFNVSNALHWNSETVKIRGAGSKLTRLVFPSAATEGLRVGTGGAFVSDLGSDGYVTGLRLSGPGAPGTARTGVAGFTVDECYFLSVEGLYVDGWDVGYDLRHNNYGTEFRNVHTRYESCNLGLRIRNGFESGNDVMFYNCWLGGKYHAIIVEPDNATTGTDGFHFFGGQVSGGVTGTDNDRGVVQIGTTWTTGAVTSSSATRVTFTATTFEAYRRQWGIYLAMPTDLDLDGVAFTLVDYGADSALGIIKHALPYHDNIQLRHVSVDGPAKTALISLSPDPGSDPTYIEIGSRGRPIVNGVTLDLYQRGIFDRMNLSRGIAISGGTKSTVMIDGLRLRNNAGTLQRSTDGTTWSALDPQYVNLLTANQSSAATDVTEVFPGNATAARETTVVPQGSTTSVKLTSTNATSASVTLESIAPTFGVAGNTVTGRVMVLAGSATATRQARISLIWRNASNTVLSGGVTSTAVTDSAFAWTAIEVSGVAPATAVKASVYVEWLAVPGTGEVHYATRLTVARTA